MKTLSLILLTLFSIGNPDLKISADPVLESMEYYCNARYDFCVEYPENIFVKEAKPVNADGILLKSKDEKITMTVYGEYNVLKYTLEEQLNLLLQTITGKSGSIDNLLTIYSEDSVVSTFERGNQQIEIRCQQFDDHFVTVVLEIEEKENAKYQNLLDEITVRITI